MKKALPVFLLLCVLLTLAACAGGADSTAVSQVEFPSPSVGEFFPLRTSRQHGSESDTTETDERSNEPEATAAEVLASYNKALERVAGRKVAFTKTRQTGNETYEADFVLTQFKDLICQFMGIGEENVYTAEVKRNDLNYSRYIRVSTLTEEDITSASRNLSGDDYVLTIRLKNGSSSVGGGVVERDSPIDKSGISTGEGDKEYYDHKTAENIYDALSEIADNAEISESCSSAAIKATVNKKTGNLTELVVTFDLSFELSRVMGSGAKVTGTTTVSFTDFKW